MRVVNFTWTRSHVLIYSEHPIYAIYAAPRFDSVLHSLATCWLRVNSFARLYLTVISRFTVTNYNVFIIYAMHM